MFCMIECMHACVRACGSRFFVACNEKNGVRMGIDRKTDRERERIEVHTYYRRTYMHGEAILVV